MGKRDRIRFSQATLQNLEQGTYRDTECKYLTLRVGVTSKTFYYVRKINGRTPYIKIGRWPELKVATARRKHDEISGNIAQGEEAIAPKPKSATFGTIYQQYMENHIKPKRATSVEDERRYRLYMLQWENRCADRITPAMVEALHLKIGSTDAHPIAANRVIEQVGRIYNYAARHGWPALRNPTENVEKYPERRRRRFLRGGELKALFDAIKGERLANELQDEVIDVDEMPLYRTRGPASPIALDCFEVLLWTGQRKMTVMTMRFDQVDLVSGIWRIPEKPKPGVREIREQTIVLGPATKIIKRRLADRQANNPYVFPGRYGKGHIKELRYSWDTVMMRAGLNDVTIHDLRRTLGSWLAGTGGNLRTIQDILGHASMAATRIYTELDLTPLISAHNVATAAMLKAIGIEDEE